VRHYDCDIPDNRTGVALVRSTDSQRPPPPPTTQAQRNTALPLQRSRNARVHRAAGRTNTSNQPLTQNSARLQPTQRTPYTRMQNTNTQVPHARATSRTAPTMRTAKLLPRAHRCAHATYSWAHSSDHPTRRPQKITPSHTRGLRATLTAELSGRPASTGCRLRVG
jgi:hypothetical protein